VPRRYVFGSLPPPLRAFIPRVLLRDLGLRLFPFFGLPAFDTRVLPAPLSASGFSLFDIILARRIFREGDGQLVQLPSSPEIVSLPLRRTSAGFARLPLEVLGSRLSFPPFSIPGLTSNTLILPLSIRMRVIRVA